MQRIKMTREKYDKPNFLHPLTFTPLDYTKETFKYGIWRREEIRGISK